MVLDDAGEWDLLGIPVRRPTADHAAACDAVLLSSDSYEEVLFRRCRQPCPTSLVLLRLYC